MTQWAKGLATKPGTLSLMPRSPRAEKERSNFPKLSSDCDTMRCDTFSLSNQSPISERT